MLTSDVVLKIRVLVSMRLEDKNKRIYDYKVELTGVGNRSQINTDDNIVL